MISHRLIRSIINYWLILFTVFLKGFVLWTILVRIFRVALLFVCQSSYRLSPCPCSLGATIVSYQSRFRLSRTFFESFWKKFVSPFLQVVLNQESHYILSFGESFFVRFSGEGGIWTLAPLLTTCTLSRGVSSTTWVLLQNSWFTIIILL